MSLGKAWLHFSRICVDGVGYLVRFRGLNGLVYDNGNGRVSKRKRKRKREFDFDALKRLIESWKIRCSFLDSPKRSLLRDRFTVSRDRRVSGDSR